MTKQAKNSPAILHSWRERRVQELEELIAKQSGSPRSVDSASSGNSQSAPKEIRMPKHFCGDELCDGYCDDPDCPKRKRNEREDAE